MAIWRDRRRPNLGGLALISRRFPPLWSVEETEACYIVRDANGQALAYVYFGEKPGRRAAAKLLPATKRGLSPPRSRKRFSL